jgi:hypothetical protein
MKKSMLPLIFACISGLLVISTAIYQYREKIVAEKKSYERQVSLDSANAEIIRIQKKLNEKTEYISNYLTGGDGFPYISFTDLKSENALNIAFILYNDGEFPLYEVNVIMYDYDILKKKEIETKGMGGEFEKHPEYKLIKIDDYKSATVFQIKEELPAKSHRIIDAKFPLKESKYSVIINSRNGTITERIAFLEDEPKKFIYIIEVYNSQDKLLKRIEGEFINNANRERIEKAIKEIPKSLKYAFIN